MHRLDHCELNGSSAMVDSPAVSLADLGARINEAHHLAIGHAGKAIEQAIACGQLLLEAKAKVPHGKWLPWLRNNISFGERSAQGTCGLRNVSRPKYATA